MGVIDIGSNSVRLVVYEGAVRAPVPIFNEKVLAGLGRNVASKGELEREGVARSLEALTRFRAINRILGVKNVRAIATAAMRVISAPFVMARDAPLNDWTVFTSTAVIAMKKGLRVTVN